MSAPRRASPSCSAFRSSSCRRGSSPPGSARDSQASVAPLALLGLAVVFTTTNAVLSQYLFARGRPALLAVAQAGLAAANLVLTIALLLTVGDIWVAALATLVVEGIGAIIVLPLLAGGVACRCARCSPAGPQPVAVGVVAALPTLVLARCRHEHGLAARPRVVGAAWAAALRRGSVAPGAHTTERALVRLPGPSADADRAFEPDCLSDLD